MNGGENRRPLPEPVSGPRQGRLRVVGDVHGDRRGFTAASATARFIIQLGDLVDHGPDSAGVLALMFALIDEGRGIFLLGNHDYKLARALAGDSVRIDAALAATLAALDPALAARARKEIPLAPAWLHYGDFLFVHGAFHPAMLDRPAEPFQGRPQGPYARALYGEPTGRTLPNGYPERSLGWVNRIPQGMTVYCGHDQESRNQRPYERIGAGGGKAVFLDTGAGKGGHLSWIDLDPYPFGR